MRNIAMLAGLVVILAIMIGLSGLHIAPVGGLFIDLHVDGLIEDWHYVLSGEPGDLLYIATYDDFLEDWEISADSQVSTEVIDDRLRITSDAPDKLVWSTTRQHFTNFDMRVEATVVDGPVDNGFGVTFRFQDSDNFYRFFISSDGFYRVFRRVEGAGQILSEWIPSPLINQGIDATNSLRVIGNGDRFQFYINDELAQVCVPDDPESTSTFFGGECLDGQMLDTLVDNSLVTGRLGVIITTLSDPGVAVEFDNVLVFAPEATE